MWDFARSVKEPTRAFYQSNSTIRFSAGQTDPIQPSPVAQHAISDTISKTLKILYPSHNTDKLTQAVMAKAETYRAASPATAHLPTVRDWYKDEVIYRIYPDAIKQNGKQNFRTLIKILPHLKDLGVTTLYILPFFKSPMGDGGFDISDYKDVQKQLGGLAQCEAFFRQAKAMGFKLKADVVLNHVSDEHPWFKTLLDNGAHQDKFYIRHQQPVFKKEIINSNTVCHYQEPDGRVTSRPVILNDSVDNHYRQINLKGKPAWAYHSFYPFQPDINWQNPDVMLYILDVIGFWSSKGVDIFRLDALNFLIKQPGHNGQSHPHNLEVAKLISLFLQAMSPNKALIAEVEGVAGDKLRQYFNHGKVNMAYAFPTTAELWHGLLTEKAAPIYNAMQHLPSLPAEAEWIGFLRNHDELMLGNYLPANVTRSLVSQVGENGQPFRKGTALGGRLGSFLGNNPDRTAMAQAILLSLPMVPELYYGDEWGLQNNPAHAFKKAEERRRKGVESPLDARDFNRGGIDLQLFNEQLQNPVRQSVKQWIGLRKSSVALRRGDFKPINGLPPGLLAFKRSAGNESAEVYHNLTGTAVPLDKPVYDHISNRLIHTLKPYQSIIHLSRPNVKPAQWSVLSAHDSSVARQKPTNVDRK